MIGEEGCFLASSRTFDLIVLDVMLPGRNGLHGVADLRFVFNDQRAAPIYPLSCIKANCARVS